jgi:hypothetical protein
MIWSLIDPALRYLEVLSFRCMARCERWLHLSKVTVFLYLARLLSSIQSCSWPTENPNALMASRLSTHEFGCN